MVIVQRIVVRWGKDERGAQQATLRGRVSAGVELPVMPSSPLVVHGLLAESRTGYEPIAEIRECRLPTHLPGLHLSVTGDTLRVARVSTSAAFPHLRHPVQLFQLGPGERARYRANVRFSGYNIPWYYEEWTVNIAYAPWHRELFLAEDFDHELDERVSLYGW